MNNNQEPIILGELKKEKSSKPIVAIIVFILVLGVCFGLPYIKSLVSDDFSLSDLLNKPINNVTNTNGVNTPSPNDNSTTTTTTGTTTTTTVPTTTRTIQNTLTELKQDTILNTNNIFLNNIIINENNITYTISARENINLDEGNYILSIYNENRELLTSIKLTGFARTVSNTTSQEAVIPTSSTYYVTFKNETTGD